jgi:hypothetical protein
VVASIGKIVQIGALAAVAFVGLVGAKWYYTAASEPIHPERGVYGMDGMEIWIDINARMPSFARDWGCKTLRDREKEVLGWNSLPPYSCQPGFGEMEDRTAYQTAADANLAQAVNGLEAAMADAVKACFEAKMAASITLDEIQAMNQFDQVVMTKVVTVINQNARACKAEVAG